MVTLITKLKKYSKDFSIIFYVLSNGRCMAKGSSLLKTPENIAEDNLPNLYKHKKRNDLNKHVINLTN